GGAATNDPEPTVTTSSPAVNSTSPSSTKNESTWSSWVCGSTPSQPGPYASSNAEISSSAASTCRSPPSGSPAPGGVTTASAGSRPPSAGGSKLSNGAVSSRRCAANPVLGVWKLRKSAVP